MTIARMVAILMMTALAGCGHLGIFEPYREVDQSRKTFKSPLPKEGRPHMATKRTAPRNLERSLLAMKRTARPNPKRSLLYANRTYRKQHRSVAIDPNETKARTGFSRALVVSL